MEMLRIRDNGRGRLVIADTINARAPNDRIFSLLFAINVEELVGIADRSDNSRERELESRGFSAASSRYKFFFSVMTVNYLEDYS